MNKNNLEKFITDVLAIEAESAKEAKAIGYMAHALVQATLPHSSQKGNEFERQNGLFRLNILAPSKIGLPYGSLPRLIMAWLTTEAVRTKSRDVVLGNTLSEFMTELGLVPTGGRWGSITRLRDQMTRLFASSISCTYDDGKTWAIKNVNPVAKANLWWDPQTPDQTCLFQSTVRLGEEFFSEAIESPIPIDMRALKALKRSPMALDIYCWLTYRLSYLKKTTSIPWEVLQIQFGAEYARTRDFKKKFLTHLRAVSTLYPEAKLSLNDSGLELHPSKPHIQLIQR